ncbi:MAG: hypothetical protein GF419_09860 [Ignavibacteriales bacterium]|nr:hypothetical protein [Ignavibacteriales bacterium]
MTTIEMLTAALTIFAGLLMGVAVSEIVWKLRTRREKRVRNRPSKTGASLRRLGVERSWSHFTGDDAS